MKKTYSIKWLVTLVIVIAAFGQTAFAQTETKRLPDGTIVYSDGSVRKPNGEMRYPKSGTRLPDGTVMYPERNGTKQSDGTIIYPDGTVRYPDGSVRYPDGTVRYPNTTNKNTARRLPPGQAKKIYGSKSARDYAPGHNKGNKQYGHGKGKSNGKGKGKK